MGSRCCVDTVKMLGRYSGDVGLARNLSKVNKRCDSSQSGTEVLEITSQTLYNKWRNTENSLFGFFEFFKNLKKSNF